MSSKWHPKEKQLDNLMQAGYDLLQHHPRTTQQTKAACDKWLEAWELVKQMATPEMRTTQAFDDVYPNMLQSVYNWSGDLEMELGNADYDEQRIRYVHEFLAQFPDEGDDNYVSFKRAEAEALWVLGRQTQAEAVYQALVEKLPDKAWAYIGWSDEYYLGSWTSKDYERGEAILMQALDRPNLDEREYVLDRLVRLYEEWGQPEKGAPLAAERDEIRAEKEAQSLAATEELARLIQQYAALASEPQEHEKPKKLKRNDPCWCGSGKKYKHCHMRSDRGRRRE